MKDWRYVDEILLKNPLACCYEFLECNSDDKITTVRENFLYKIWEAFLARDTNIKFYKFYAIDGDNYSQEVEKNEIQRDIIVLCDSYISIILSRIGNKDYDIFLKGFSSPWNENDYRRTYFVTLSDENPEEEIYNEYFPLRFPREEEGIEMEPVEYIDKKEYLKILNRVNNYSSGDGFNRFTSSLTIIINLEQKIMDEHQIIKRMRKKYVPLGRLNGNIQKIREENIRTYPERQKLKLINKEKNTI